jgi:hypothetical protein
MTLTYLSVAQYECIWSESGINVVPRSFDPDFSLEVTRDALRRGLRIGSEAIPHIDHKKSPGGTSFA